MKEFDIETATKKIIDFYDIYDPYEELSYSDEENREFIRSELKEPDRIQLILDAIESVDCEDLDSFEQEVLMEAAKWAWLALENCKTKREKIKTGIAK